MGTFDLGEIRESLQKLNWGKGLTRDGIRAQWTRMSASIYDALPLDYKFRDEGEAMSYFDQLLRHGVIQNLHDTGDAPNEYKPTLGNVTNAAREPGVGSGGDPGYTGGGSVQTGVGRQGTTYGDTEERT